MSDKEKKFAYCYDKHGRSLDYKAYNQILGVSKKQQEKVIGFIGNYSVNEFKNVKILFTVN